MSHYDLDAEDFMTDAPFHMSQILNPPKKTAHITKAEQVDDENV